MIKTIEKASDLLSKILFLIIATFAFLLVGMRLFGFEIYTVLSGSMEPAYHTGSVIYVKPVESTDLEVGDVITYKIPGNNIATHRIVEVVSENGTTQYRTKGDANEVIDGSPVNYQDIIGTPVFTIPYLGFIANYIQHPPGIYVVATASLTVLLLSLIPGLFTDKKEQKE